MNEQKGGIDLSSSVGKREWINYIHALQNTICVALEKADGNATFTEDVWTRPEGGGGITRMIRHGSVFEKGGVNTSVVYGEVTSAMRSQLKNISLSNEPLTWWACGISLVLHPVNPFVPAVHCNYRMFELYKNENSIQNSQTGHKEIIDQWFGGGTDLTPYYLFDEDARHFHQAYKNVCDQYDPTIYYQFKEGCDNYFVNTHRNNERRGIGGIFYDYLRPDNARDVNYYMNLGQACGNAFLDSFLPILERRKNMPFSPENKYWQEIRRGRYVEFNLIHDRGTLFGLKTGGRTESILMSLPPLVRFDYDYQPGKGSEEDKLLQVCLHPKSWV